ncbi:hypothetical protein CEV32_4209 [Brucella rhizosphaerae]|uniref:Uncharacterized protein n=1 Tax=Brucella rhizosphaerae TaxID=571254 RepID=A0A256FPB2_9HYPH|nr:hypothetical protein CEV32_4209 [Brucella rhizosphaerae]
MLRPNPVNAHPTGRVVASALKQIQHDCHQYGEDFLSNYA